MSEEADGTVPLAERHLRVERSARYWTLGEPGVDDVWIVLHGYGQLARRFLRRFGVLGAPSRMIVAPEGLSRFYIGSGEGRHGPDARVGATWMTREDREAEIRDYVAYLDGLAATTMTRDGRLTLLGFSQGVATAWRWVTYGSAPGLVRLVAWAGTLPPDLDLERARKALGGAEVVLIAGELDDTVTPDVTEEGAGRLRGAGIDCHVVHHGGGHDIDAATLRTLAG